MAKARLVQLRVPEELLRRIDGYVSEGLYKSRSEVIVDATRRFLERSAPASPLEGFIESYLRGRVKPSKNVQKSLHKIFGKLRTDRSWHARFGDTPEEVMRSLRSRAT
jgi:Arc/MetJ-type ribon-helix-helix transcriptional regulator